MFEVVTQWDFNILYLIQETIRTPFLDSFCAMLSYAFEAGFLWIVTAVVLIAFRKTRVAGVSLLCSMLLALLIGELGLKNIICRERPCVVDSSVALAIPAPSSYSFPSGHTGSSFAAAGGIFAFNKKLGIPALGLALLVGLSRMYLFVHFPTDVLAGAVLGILCAFATYLIFTKTHLDRKLQSFGR